MDWIKKNPAQVALAVVALGVIGSSVVLWQNIGGFAESFSAGHVNPTFTKGIPELDTKVLETAAKAIGTPGSWTSNDAQGSLFVSRAYIKDGNVIAQPGDRYFQPPAPNKWLTKYSLNYLDNNVLSEDPDRDGFTNLLEFAGLDGKSHLSDKEPYGQPVVGEDGKPLPDDSTSPIDPSSHPPYHTRLTLAPLPNGQVGIVNIPFRLKVMSWDQDTKNKTITVAINTIDRGARTHFVDIGLPIPNTPYTTEKFEKKEVPGADGTTKDVSELTIVNKTTGKRVTLPLGVVVDSPDSYVVLRYLWAAAGGQPTADMNKKKDDTFTLPPENDKIYKVVDIKAPNPQNGAPGEVTILLPSGATLILKTSSPLAR